jgi:hypothetical protein
MADEPKSKRRLEIAHVLFIDIVGYSKLRINEQSAQIDTLRDIVRGLGLCGSFPKRRRHWNRRATRSLITTVTL